MCIVSRFNSCGPGQNRLVIDNCRLRFKRGRPILGADQGVNIEKLKRSSRVSWRTTSAAAYGLLVGWDDQLPTMAGEVKVVGVCIEFKLAEDAMTGSFVA